MLAAMAADHPDLRSDEIEQVVEIFFDEIATRLAEGGRVEMRGFGTFSTRPRDARTGTQSAHRRDGRRTGQARSLFQAGQGNARALNTD